MAQNVSLWGASYSNVPSIEVPKTGGGTAQFDDTTIDSGAAGAADITLNKKAWVNGVLLTGTNQGGGGTEAGTVTQDANGFLVLDDDSGGKVDPSDATATVADILYPKTAYVSGGKVTGSIATKTSADLQASGATVTVPAGYYASQATKSVASGSATPAASISATGATVTAGTNTLTFSKSVSNTPQVSAGYISAGSSGNTSVSLTASIDTRSSSDLTASNLTVTAPSGYYASNATKTLSDEYLLAENIKKNITIFGVTGSFEGGGGGGLVYETGTWTPATDSEGYFINFANSHTTAPFYYAIWCVSSFVSSSSGGVIYSNVHQAIGEPLHTSASGLRYGYAQKIISSGANSISNLSYPYTNQGDSSGSYSRYWAKETGINAPQYSSGYPWRAGSTYKWIAVWAPTS